MSATTIRKTSTQGQSQSRTMPNIWQILVGGLGVVTVIALCVYLITAITFINRPFFGALVSHTLVVNNGQPTVDGSWAALAAGVESGDQIIEIGGTSLFSSADRTDYTTAHQTFREELATWNGRSPLDIVVLRDGNEVPLTLNPSEDFPANGMPFVDVILFFIAPFATGVLTLSLGLFILYHRYDAPEGLMGAVIAFGSALFTGGLFDVGTTGALTPIWLIGNYSLTAGLILLGINFPKRIRELRQMPVIDYAILGIFAAIIGFMLYMYAFPSAPETQASVYTPLSATIGGVGVLILWMLASLHRKRATNAITRDQANSVYIGSTLMLIPVGLWYTTRFTGIDLLPFNLEAITVFVAFPVGAIAYAVLQYRVLNTENITRRGLTYGIMIGALILSMYLISLGGAFFSIGLFNANGTINAFMIAVILFVMVFMFTPLRDYLQTRIDRIYFREQHNLQARTQTFNRTITSLNEYDKITEAFYTTVKEVLSPQKVHFFLRDRTDGSYIAQKINGSLTDIEFTGDSPLIGLLDEEENHIITVGPNEKWPHNLRVDQPRLNLLNAQMIAGLPGSNHLNGFVILTHPMHKDIYSYDEIVFFNDVASQLAIATERTQVITTLERRVQELDVLSQVGQAVNYTIELDDLLELIYNQTSRLLPVPNFYIVLYQENIDRLYFAFFLEGDDRFDKKESVRWLQGNDLFSEIIKTNSPIRVENFTTAMKDRSADLDLISDGLYAWMGVPLAGGSGTLGVMAAGKRNDRTDYTDEQFKIFSDVAALAATSLDKANLFNQTKIRQRQLSVLNDISRQLVATETDVEALLSIITTSATEILNAEAGTLFLATDDDSGDLEFRVVIGGGGEDLIGTRIPSGQGVVGKVVATNEPIIVNDAEADPRHNVDVTEGFVSRSLLTVPLTAKDNVIGVLQVLNKTDGTPFVDDDANLLTTFASQAAVALENARLFQQTDQQLSARVKELETLERLDSQLNRTLDLGEVAAITVNQAMDILGADAGALGIVHENPPYLEIVSIKGYKREEYPPDAVGDDGRIWQLDSGVVKRVMRSRQADITMDVTMDPDYEHGLTDSNSQITLPMISGDEINAILILEKNSLPRFSLPDWALATRIADHASVAIANAQFYLALDNAMKSKSEFMGFAAHELKNPLASVKGYAEVMLSGMTGELSEQQENFLGIIKTNAERMKTLIDDLRDSAKIDSNEFRVEAEPMNIRNAVVETLRPFVNQLAEKNQELVNSVPENLPLIWGDETRVIQVLTNLVSNAHKYSFNDTTIEVGGEVREGYVNRNGERRDRMVVIWVTDQGIGMSDEDQKRLFKERYFRSTNTEAQSMASGTGLGMTLTYNIMIQHQGDIWIESVKGEGSTFFISFPLADDMETKVKALEGVGD